MLEYITLGLVIVKYALDYFAPRTKTKWDDKARDVADKLPLPTLGEAAAKAASQMAPQPRADGGVVDAPGTGPRDHRTK